MPPEGLSFMLSVGLEETVFERTLAILAEYLEDGCECPSGPISARVG